MGYDTSDDAAVWLIRDDLAAVLTVDFFTPIVDDPYEFGRIAAANALSDIFAMGATPHVALNLLALDCKLDPAIATAIMQGGADAVAQAGAFICGGHTIDDLEPKYGLSVFGTVNPHELIKNQGAQTGDLLYLTKPIGTGILSSAHSSGVATNADFEPAIQSMMTLNDAGAHALRTVSAHAATDITGFGLAGHLHEMLKASGVSARLDCSALPVFDRVVELAAAKKRPGKTKCIIRDLADVLETDALAKRDVETWLSVVCDPQTSGGILAAVHPDRAHDFEQAFAEKTGSLPYRIGEITSDLASGAIALHP